MGKYGRQSLLEEIDALDWREAEGITEKAKLGTNSGLAERDYSVKCKTGTEPIAIINGSHLWFCYSHYQPSRVCNLQASEAELRRLKTDIIKQIKDAPYWHPQVR